MKAIADHYGPEHAACLAIEAGCDTLLVCSRLDWLARARDALAEKASTDPRFRQRLENAVERALSTRARRIPQPITDPARLTEALEVEAAVELAREIEARLKRGCDELRSVRACLRLLLGLSRWSAWALCGLPGPRPRASPQQLFDRPLYRPGGRRWSHPRHGWRLHGHRLRHRWLGVQSRGLRGAHRVGDQLVGMGAHGQPLARRYLPQQRLRQQRQRRSRQRRCLFRRASADACSSATWAPVSPRSRRPSRSKTRQARPSPTWSSTNIRAAAGYALFDGGLVLGRRTLRGVMLQVDSSTAASRTW